MNRVYAKVYGTIYGERLAMVNGDLTKIWIPEKPFADMTTDEIRKYVTFFTELGYERNIDVPYSEKKDIITKLNEEWNRRVGEDFTRLYNHLDSVRNKEEKWNGEERYKFFSYNFKGYTEFSVLKETKATFNLLKEKGISVDDYMQLMELSRGWYWDMTSKSTAVSDDRTKQRNIQYQDEFVNYVLDELSEDEARKKVWFTEKFTEPKVKN